MIIMKTFFINRKHLVRGFTLIELLVSMMILMLLGSIILVIFFSALRGTGKSQSLISLRQNGNFALSQMTKNLRQAKNVSCSPDEPSEITFTSFPDTDQGVTTYRCTEEGIASINAEQTSYFLDNSDEVSLSACSFTCDVRPNSEIPYVKIFFRLSSPETSQVAGEEGLTFTSTVLPRNTSNE